MKKISILVYLNSGGINGKSNLAKLQFACRENNIDYKIYVSKYPKHSKKLIKEIVVENINNPNHRIVVVGGDGTLNEAVYGLITNNLEVPIAYFPSGTGNDFARSLELTDDANKFICELFNVATEKLELIYAKNNENDNIYIGLNGIGVGFDALVSYLSKKNKSYISKFNRLAYLSKIMSAFKIAKTYDISINADDKEYLFKNVLLTSFMKNCYYGGGIKIDPKSYKNNGEIGIVVLKDVNVSNIPNIFYHTLVTGKQFEKTKNMLRLSGKKIDLTIKGKQYIQADGEVDILDNVNLSLTLVSYPFYLVGK